MKQIKLANPIDGPNGQKITTIELREPRYGDYVDIGFPTAWVAVKGGGFEQETPSVIRDWVERLWDGDPNFLYALSLRDGLALRDAVLDFFREALAPLAPAPTSTQSHAPSSSAPA